MICKTIICMCLVYMIEVALPTTVCGTGVGEASSLLWLTYFWSLNLSVRTNKGLSDKLASTIARWRRYPKTSEVWPLTVACNSLPDSSESHVLKMVSLYIEHFKLEHISHFYWKALLFWKGSRHTHRWNSTPSILTHLPTLKRVLHSRGCLLGSYFGTVSLLEQWSLHFYCTFDQNSIHLQCTCLASWESLEHRMLLICLYFPRVPFSIGQSV